MKQLSVLGCGAMGTCIANLIASNVHAFDDCTKNILWYVRDENHDGTRLLSVIHKTKRNAKYAPDVQIADNITPSGDAVSVVRASDVIFFVYSTRHVHEMLSTIKDYLKPTALFVSFSKGVLVSELDANIPDKVIRLVSEEIQEFAKHRCVVVSGAVNAKGLSRGDFAEATIGCDDLALANEAKRLLQNQNFYLTCTQDVVTVEICGAFKSVLSVAAGIVDGLQLGANTKSAVIRLGLFEIGHYCSEMYSEHGTSYTTLLQSCGISEVFLCMLYRSDEVPKPGDDFDMFNMIIGRNLVETSLSLEEIEKNFGLGFSTSGADCARKVNAQLEALNLTSSYPLFTAVHLICTRQIPPSHLIKMLDHHPAHM